MNSKPAPKRFVLPFFGNGAQHQCHTGFQTLKIPGQQVSFLDQLEEKSYGGVWVTGGYKTDWISAHQAAKLARIPLIILQEIFVSFLSEHANYRIGALAFAEREGSYVNAGERLQSFRWAIRPPAGVMPEGQLFWQLSGRKGMYRANEVLDEVADLIPYFQAAKSTIPAVGVDLKGTHLVSSEA